MHREELALNQIRLRRLSQSDGDVSLAHREVQLFVGGNERDVDLRIEIQKFAEPRREPVYADAGSRRYLEFAVGSFATVRELGARGFQLHENFMRRPIQQFTLLGEDQATRVAVK